MKNRIMDLIYSKKNWTSQELIEALQGIGIEKRMAMHIVHGLLAEVTK